MASRWSRTRSLSIVTVAVVAFAALELLAARPAVAGIVCCTDSTFKDCICDASLTCNLVKNGKNYFTQVIGKTCWNTSSSGDASTIKSRIECETVSGVTTLDSTTLSRSELQDCTYLPDSGPQVEAFCQLDLSYSRPAGLTQCTSSEGSSTLTYAGSCSQTSGGSANNRLTVTGTLKCPASLNAGVRPGFCGNDDCTLSLGITASSGQCSTLFPADAELGLADGQVLSFSQTAQGSCQEQANGLVQVTEVGDLQTRYCNGGTFDGAPVSCTFGSGRTQQKLVGAGSTESAVQFDAQFGPPPNTFNVTCNPQSSNFWPFTIFGNQHLNVTLVDRQKVTVEGVPASCPDNGVNAVKNTLACQVAACPDLGPRLAAERDPVTKKVDITVTGFLTSGTAIFGEHLGVTTSP